MSLLNDNEYYNHSLTVVGQGIVSLVISLMLMTVLGFSCFPTQEVLTLRLSPFGSEDVLRIQITFLTISLSAYPQLSTLPYTLIATPNRPTYAI